MRALKQLGVSEGSKANATINVVFKPLHYFLSHKQKLNNLSDTLELSGTQLDTGPISIPLQFIQLVAPYKSLCSHMHTQHVLVMSYT